MKLFCHPLSSTTFTVNTRFPSCSEPMVLKMAEDRRAMYGRFSDKGAHSAEWFEIVKNFLKLAFADGRHEAKFSCIWCGNRRMLSEYEMSSHIAKHRFMQNYLVWHQHGEVHAATPAESDGRDDEDWMDDMIADIGIEYCSHFLCCSTNARNYQCSTSPRVFSRYHIYIFPREEVPLSCLRLTQGITQASTTRLYRSYIKKT
jgi:hypothetical protein